MDPVSHVYPAIVWTLVGWTLAHAAVAVIMQGYCLARSLAGRLTPEHDIDLHNVVLYWHFLLVTAAVTFAVVGSFPWPCEVPMQVPPKPVDSLWTLITAPVVWAVHFLLCYVAAAVVCAKRDTFPIGFDALRARPRRRDRARARRHPGRRPPRLAAMGLRRGGSAARRGRPPTTGGASRASRRSLLSGPQLRRGALRRPSDPLRHGLPVMRPVALLAGLGLLALLWGGPLLGAEPRVASRRTCWLTWGWSRSPAPLLAIGIAGTRWDFSGVHAAAAPVPASVLEFAVVWGWHAPAMRRLAIASARRRGRGAGELPCRRGSCSGSAALAGGPRRPPARSRCS